MPAQRILTLLTDFGERDVYVGVMKGAIAQINPHLRVIDLTHQIPAQNLLAARFNLMTAYPHFPPETVHIAVVDPGVGSPRRAIALQLADGFLVGPDNGIFSGILATYPARAAVILDNPTYWITHTPSLTFHGRDIFAPAGAHLASGVPLQALGSVLDLNTLTSISPPGWTDAGSHLIGSVQYVDHFGNLITTVPAATVQGKSWAVAVGAHHIPGSQTYSDAPPGEAIALVGSHGWVELAVNGGNAQTQLEATWGTPIQIVL